MNVSESQSTFENLVGVKMQMNPDENEAVAQGIWNFRYCWGEYVVNALIYDIAHP